MCLTGTYDGQSAELQCSKYSDLASSEQSIVEQFCHASVSPASSDVSATVKTSTTMFFKSPENSCCGSVTVKSELPELAPGLHGTCPDAGDPEMEGEELQQDFWNWDMPFETPSCNSQFSFSGNSEVECSSLALPELDVCRARRPPVCPPRSLDLLQSSVRAEKILSQSELPTPVRCLLTPPDSLTSSPHSDPAGEDTMMSMNEVGSHSDSPDDVPSSPENSGFLVLTPVTKRPRLTHPGCTTIRYNRKNNPELDRRRVHFCDFPGKSYTYGVMHEILDQTDRYSKQQSRQTEGLLVPKEPLHII